MATKKKAAKPAPKKNTPVKKAAPAKKPAAKPVSKASKPAPKKAEKPSAKKTEKAPVKKASKPAAPAHKAAPVKPAVVAKNNKQTEVKKPVMPKKEEKKPEVKKIEEKKPEVKKVEEKKAEAKKPVSASEASAKEVHKKPTLIDIPPAKKPAPVQEKPVKVVIPEMKTKTVRKYEPEFTKSVLDQPETPATGPTLRYSDAELQEFRELIQKKLDQAKKELTYLQGLITRKDEMGGDENENRYMTMEDGSMSMEREQLAQMASRQINYIDHLEKALMRIENRTYGICRVTGKLIDKARLRAVPHATLSIEAKQMMNK
ncbi:MAG: TraR/DksA family transcriptional regulator [Chitinophagaceae bacterium]|nr:TraR/DksA family transcriptional regulator [Chitinophagaceae bacterium]